MNRLEAFEILGVDVTDDKKVIKKAYAELVKRYHPEEYPEKWKEIHEAYEIALKGADSAQFSFCTYDEKQVKTGGVNFKPVIENTLDDEKKEWEREADEGTEEEKNECRCEEPEGKEQERKIDEEQEIDIIFDRIDELMQEKREQEKEEREKKERKEKKIQKRKERKRKLINCITYIFIFLALITKFSEMISEEREKEKTTETVEQMAASLMEQNEVLKEGREWQYEEFSLFTIVKCYDEEQQNEVLEGGICLQEGIYLTSQQKQMSHEADIYAIREADVPEQLKLWIDDNCPDCYVWAFCVNSSEEPEYKSLWCDLEKLGFDDRLRIFYYNKFLEKYIELELFGEDENFGHYSYRILDYRAFIVDTHVHGEGEKCRYPIVFIRES